MGLIAYTVLWVVALVAAEVAALVVGAVGCVTGSLALYKAIKALNQITNLENRQSESISKVAQRTEVLERELKSIAPDLDE